MQRIGYFSERDAKTIATTIRRINRTNPIPGGRNNPTQVQRARVWEIKFVAPAGGIPAASGNTAAKAECEILFGELNESTGDVTLVPSGEFEMIYNWAEVVVCDEGERRGVAALHADLIYWVESESCPPESESAFLASSSNLQTYEGTSLTIHSGESLQKYAVT